MKKIYCSLVVLLCFFNGYSQLFVGPNSYVYAKDALLFVKQGVNIDETSSASINGKLYLRREAQLLQGTTGTSTNIGDGKLSVFQEGTSNEFYYNFWCSPVGNAINANPNQPFDISMLYLPTTVTASTQATNSSAPTYNGTTSAGSLNIANYWIWKFLPGLVYADWDFVGNSALGINAGEGFTMKGTNGTDITTAGESTPNKNGDAQRYDFRGKPNDGTISIPVAANQYTLTGNPYPSAIDLEKFLESADAANSKRVAYFYEQATGLTSHNVANYVAGYNTYSAGTVGTDYDGAFNVATLYTHDGAGMSSPTGTLSSNNYNRKFLPIGQGFMIEGENLIPPGSTIQMKNIYRAYVKEGVSASTTQLTKNGNNSYGYSPEIQSVSGFDYSGVSMAPVPQIKFITSYDTNYVGQLTLAFSNNATDGVDLVADAESPSDEDTKELYFAINQQNTPYCINYTNFDINKKVPLGFRTNANTSFKIKMQQMINFDGASNVYLHDKVTDEYFDITTTAHEITMPAGDNTTRFEITFQNSALSTSSNNYTTLSVIQNNTNQTLTINNPKSLDLKSASLFDVTGKLIFNKSNLGSKTNYEFSTSTLSEGVYLVKIDSADNQHFGEKVIISHTK